jgi:hypothetical protein
MMQVLGATPQKCALDILQIYDTRVQREREREREREMGSSAEAECPFFARLLVPDISKRRKGEEPASFSTVTPSPSPRGRVHLCFTGSRSPLLFFRIFRDGWPTERIVRAPFRETKAIRVIY